MTKKTKGQANEAKQKYSKSAFIDAEKSTRERLLLMTLLKDKETYTKSEVEKLLKEWKAKKVQKKEVEK